MIKLNENRNYPYEGYFWIINDEIIGITAEVPHYNYEFSLNGKTHENTWKNFRSDFLVNNKIVNFDYFPRGRVMVDPEYHLDGSFDEYTCMVFLDKCLNEDKYKKMIIDYYNLDLPSIHRVKFTMLNERTGIDHYTCHNCRNY